MTFTSEPIVIAAIAAGGAAVLVLLIAGSILLHRRLHPLPTPTSRPSTSASRNRRTPNGNNTRHAPSSSGSRSSTRKSPIASINPYHTPTVPRVQPPPQCRPGSKARPSIPPADFPYSPTYTPVEIPSTAPGQAGLGTKLRKLDYKTPLPPTILPRSSPTQVRPSPTSTQRTPKPHPPNSNFDSILSPPEISRPMSAGSSVMFITYEQGLAKLGLSNNTPRPPLPTANTMTTISSHPSYTTSGPSSHSSPLVNIPNPSPLSSTRSAYAQQLRTPSTASSGGDTKYRPHLISMTAVSTITGPTSPVRRYRRESIPRTITPESEYRPSSLTYTEGGRTEVWEDEQVEMPPEGDRGAWLPSYYMPKAEKAVRSKSRWGGRV